MAQGFESQNWYRVAHLRPALASRVEITRQMFRREPWFVLRDPITGKFTRLNEAAHWLVSQMNGQEKLGALLDAACAELGDAAPSQDEMLSIVAQLSKLDLLRSDADPDTAQMAERGRKVRKKGLLARFMNPLAVRFPLYDPDRLVTALYPLVRPFISVFGALLYLLLIGTAIVAAARHWNELTGNVIDRVLATESLLLLVLVYPFVKLLHEFGHAFTTKHWGGEVREVGVMMLVFIPVPYVDASASTGFRSKWARMLVSGSGILVELGLAAIAMLLWTQLEDGLWRAACFNIMLIGGVSTLLFNGNPLLRFDGYFVMADWVEIPNLGNRSNRYIGYLIQRYLFGRRAASSPVQAPGERGWLFTYAIAAFFYRLFISITIILLVASRFLALGVLLAIWSASLIFVLPLLKHLRFVATAPQLQGIRRRAVMVTLACVAAIVGAVGFLPVPHRTVAEGVVYPPESTVVTATAAGQVAALLADPLSEVAAGQPLLRLRDDFAEARVIAAEAEAHKYALRYEQAVSESAFDMRLWAAQAARASSEAQDARQRVDDLVVLSPRAGTFVLPNPGDVEQIWLERGMPIGHVVDAAELVVRVAVHQDQAELVRNRALAVDLRSADRLDRIIPGQIVREVPTIGQRIAAPALTTEGGGIFALDPAGQGDPVTLEPILQFDVAPAEQLASTALGMRVHVRIDHGATPIAERLWWRVRQVFLRRLNV